MGVPAATIDGTGRVVVRIYPGVVSQVLRRAGRTVADTLRLLRADEQRDLSQRHGAWPPRGNRQASPRIQLQAEQLINLGYQRLLTFEGAQQPGGFSLFGDPPAQMMLTAYGLMEFR